jgi:hypothetical protein
MIVDCQHHHIEGNISYHDMKRIYYYIFYKYYLLFIVINKESIPHLKAVILLSWMISLNLLSIWYIFSLLFTFPFIDEELFISKIVPVIIFFLLVILNYRIFIGGEKFKILEEEYVEKSEFNRYIGSILVTIYTIASFIMIIWLTFIR